MRPACFQCLNSGRSCEGYPDALFVPWHSGSDSGQTKPGPPPKRVPDNVPPHAMICRQINFPDASPIYPCLTDPSERTISLIIRNYVPYREVSADLTDIVPQSPRICGSWVSALPELATRSSGRLGECLTTAMSALALSITSYKTGKQLTHPISLSYGHALRLLQHDLHLSKSCYKAEQAAAVMCAALLEVSSPTSANSWLVHIQGVGELIRLSSPDLFGSGIQHKLFIGIRPLLVIQAFMSRKATFLAEEAWTSGPFQHHQLSPLQSLLSIAASIPEVLESIDTMNNELTDTAANAAKTNLTQLMKIRMRLDSWVSCFEKESPEPLYWNQTQDKDLECRDDTLSFPSLSTANALTHLWSFQIICMSHIQDLLARFPELNGFKIIVSVAVLRNSCIELSTRILQSMKFLMRKDFMLYGRFSAGFPLNTAYQALSVDAEGRNVLRNLEESVIKHMDLEVNSFSSRIPTTEEADVHPGTMQARQVADDEITSIAK
ncbi:hypothetical protein FOPG_15785 [Fusarium oxysporum f. sp. conglutinans race 2 54008]|uniref:Zn(2)-C6 fungal-type domain-containing protein n=1 Tax=Fusarium oxysporum f. sp. conglutinans race 2 54008 TaxID=1089457 RepID=X0GXL9_FUSOX|nr:hypothetical protein FOPG_15785 [Fusarium oxysporum f. sp. conglutinans race 2 54008]